MRLLTFILILILATNCVYGQVKPRLFNLVITIDDEVSQQVINGCFFIKNKQRIITDTMKFRSWVGSLEMTTEGYSKLFNTNTSDTLYVKFKRNSTALAIADNYEAAIPVGMLNHQYLIFSIYNKKNKASRQKYYFSLNREYLFQIRSPNYNEILILNKK